MPDVIEPMLCERAYEPFDGEDWLFELKWDGYRIIAFKKKAEIRLQSRKNQNYSAKYATVIDALKKIKHDIVLDGEVIVFNDEGKPDFSALQLYKGQGLLQYYVFDVLWLDGYDLMSVPLIERKQLLKTLVQKNDTIHYLDHIEEKGKDFFELVKQRQLEGIVAKRKDSFYFPDTRSKSWIKIPFEIMQEYIIVGFTESEHGRPFSRIMFGEYRDGKLYYVHHSGGGISDALLHETYKILKPLEIKKKPVVNDPKEDTIIHWVKPVKVGQFKLKQLSETKAGHKRHPVIFLGVREDKLPEEVVADDEPVETSKHAKKTTRKKEKKFDELAVWKRIHPGEEITETSEINVDGKKIKIINPRFPYWLGNQNEGRPPIQKVNVLLYYRSIFDYIIPFLKDRPLGLNVVKKWANDTDFIRNMKDLYPPWVKIFNTERRVEKKGKSEDIDWVVCNDLPTLLYLVNLGALDLHPWAATIENPDEPDYLVIDLDPPRRKEGKTKAEKKQAELNKQKDFKNLIQTAAAVKKVIDKHKLNSFVKTSGKRGMHIFLPCVKIHYDDSRRIIEHINKEVHTLVPKISTIQTSTEHPERQERIYIDASQNDYSDRIAVAYSVRAYTIPTVSTPIEWKEVNEHLDRKAFTIDSMEQRVTGKGNFFKGLFDAQRRIRNYSILKKM